MSKFTDNELGILYKLWRNRCFGKGHMLINNLTDGFPTNIQDKIVESVKELIRKGYLVRKSSKHGQAVFINLNMKKQIETELKKKYPFL
jgi:hypothetical protein